MTSFIVMQAIDVKQTDTALKMGMVESNPVYGEHPSVLKLVGVKTLSTGLVYWIADKDEANRTQLLIVANIVQIFVLGHNYAYVEFGF